MSGVKIVKAVYGAGEQSADWTESVQKALEQDPFMPIVATNSVAGDPAPSVVKSMKISYEWRGKNGETEIAEDEGGVVPNFPDSGLAIRGASRKFKIVAVRWGWGTQSRDLTAALAPLLPESHAALLATARFARSRSGRRYSQVDGDLVRQPRPAFRALLPR